MLKHWYFLVMYIFLVYSSIVYTSYSECLWKYIFAVIHTVATMYTTEYHATYCIEEKLWVLTVCPYVFMLVSGFVWWIVGLDDLNGLRSQDVAYLPSKQCFPDLPLDLPCVHLSVWHSVRIWHHTVCVIVFTTYSYLDCNYTLVEAEIFTTEYYSANRRG